MSSSHFSLDGKSALVTGGTSGIGLATACALLDAGANVLVGSSSDNKVDDARRCMEERSPTGEAVAARLDVTDRSSVDAAVERCVQHFGRLDILINCAGTNLKQPTLEVSEEDERRIMEVNFFGALYASKAAAKRMMQQAQEGEGEGGEGGTRGGVIVNICSVTSFMGLSQVTAYACAKGALLALTRQLAVEWAPHGIRTNAVAPGFIPADQNRRILESGDRGRRILQSTPMQRFGTPDEIGGAVVYLCSEAGGFVNGACLNIDGGFMACGVGEA